MEQIRRGLYKFTNLVSIFARHGHVGKHENGLQCGEPLDRRDAIRNSFDLKALFPKDLLGYPLNNGAIVCDKD
jgi:hypothetical protein